MNYSLSAGAWNSVFAVPSSVVDKYIKLADGNSLKLLLFLLRHGGESFTEQQLRESLGIKRDGELEDAAMFWFQRGIIRMDEGELIPTGDSIQEVLPGVAEPESTEQKPSSLRRVADNSGAAIYTAMDIAQRIKTDSAVEFLFKELEQLYGRNLKNPESRMALQVTDYYGIPAEVAVMLYKFCFRIGKTTPGYIESVAKDWVNENIRTVEEADAHLSKLEKRFGVEENLRRVMDLKTKFSPTQLNYIKCWTEDWGFGEEMIILAHEMTLDRTGNMSFSYTNKILENWKNSGIYSREAAEKDKQEFQGKSKKKQEDSGSSLDMDDVMEELRRQYQ
ncbi:MAG: DnaD domain protein [Oscillospiraceae bacterium]